MSEPTDIAPEILIVGGGIAGAVSALLLARQGGRVSVVDPFPVYPADFRCEKLTSDQLARIRRLGLFDIIAPHATPVRNVIVARGGRPVDARATDELCFRYDAIVNAVRRAWPSTVTLIEGRADDIETSAERSTITLTCGRRLEARLVVLATGPGDKLRARLGLTRRAIRANHSLCIGFDVTTAAGGPLSERSLTCYGERAGDGVAFMTVFPYADRTRCNFFGYHGPTVPEIATLRKAPLEGLKALMPGVLTILGNDARVAGKAEFRVTSLYDIPDPERDGAVLIGEAFRPSCPVTGTGVTRVLNDCERLCETHIPRWLATPGMRREKIASFYADSEKRAADDASAKNAERQRDFATGTSLKVRARRIVALAKARVHFAASRQPRTALVLRSSAPHQAGSEPRAGAVMLAEANPRILA